MTLFQQVNPNLSQLNDLYFKSFEILPNIITRHPVFFNWKKFQCFESSDMVLLLRSAQDQRILFDFYLKNPPQKETWNNLHAFIKDRSLDTICFNYLNEDLKKVSDELLQKGYSLQHDGTLFNATLNPLEFKLSQNQKRKVNFTEKLLIKNETNQPSEEDLSFFIKQYKKYQVLKGFKLNNNTSSLLNLNISNKNSQLETYLVSSNYIHNDKELEVKNIVTIFNNRAFYLFGLTNPVQYKASTFSPGLHTQLMTIEFLKHKKISYYDLGQLMKNEKARGLDHFKLSLADKEEKLKYQVLTKL